MPDHFLPFEGPYICVRYSITSLGLGLSAGDSSSVSHHFFSAVRTAARVVVCEASAAHMRFLTKLAIVSCSPLYFVLAAITFMPQFKLVVCTNTLFEIRSTDDGTWRRIRKCDFDSKFLQRPYQDPLFPRERCPFQFLLDKRLDQKFPDWAPVFAYMLADVAFKTGGNVRDCDIVMAASTKYRGEQDTIANFVRNRICAADASHTTTLAAVRTALKKWCETEELSPADKPKPKEVIEYLTQIYGPSKGKKWSGMAIVQDEDWGQGSQCDKE